jgi:hypothetical protein
MQEVDMTDAEIKRLMKSLGDAINDSLSDSPRINECIHSIRDVGYDVFLVIEAKVGYSRKGNSEEEMVPVEEKVGEPVRLRITSEDAKFLKSLKISIDSER